MGSDERLDRDALLLILQELSEIKTILKATLVRPQLNAILTDEDATSQQVDRAQKLLDELDRSS